LESETLTKEEEEKIPHSSNTYLAKTCDPTTSRERGKEAL
jgi:hypothetical protein